MNGWRILFAWILAVPAVAQSRPVPAAPILPAGGSQTRPAAPASRRTPLSPSTRVAEIEVEYEDAMAAFQKAYQETKPESRAGLFETKYPKASTWFPRLLEIAKDPKDAYEAYKWIVIQHADSDAGHEALAALGRDHLQNPGLAKVADALASSMRPEAEAFLRLAARESPHAEVKGRASYALAQVLKENADAARTLRDPSDPDEQRNVEKWLGAEVCALVKEKDPDVLIREAEELLVLVKDKYAEVPASHAGTLGARADGDLFELRHLAIGMAAPEIEGEDVDGKPLRLSDFKGKVVVLDYWGYW